ncbi:MAG TPA: B-box zinc finger protein [Planctomycetota bacterium]
MSQGCANHPESMALSTCKVCQKAICLMCVHEEKDGTYCSDACIGNLREVNDWVGTGSPSGEAARPQSVAVEAPAASSVFEEMPDHVAAPEQVAEVAHPDPVDIPEEPPPASAPPPPSTSNIGNPCYAHPDIRAKAFCRRCRRPICGLCIVENASGMFCSDACVSMGRSRKMGMGAKVAIMVVVLLAAGAGAYALKPELFQGLLGGSPAAPEKKPKDPKPTPPKPEPPKPQPPKPEPPKPEPPKPQPPKPEPPKPEPPRPEPPKPLPPLPPKPPPPKPTIMVHPWTSEEPGAWFRVRRGDKVEDVGLKARDAVSYTLSTQAWSGSQAQPAAEKQVDVEPIELLGEEKLEVEGRTYLCEVRRLKDRTEWTLVTGRHAGAVLRATSPEGSQEAVRLWEHTIRLSDRSFDCLVIESRLGEGRLLKSWYCPTYPLKTVRVERDGTLLEALVDCGYNWTSRQAPK